VILAKRVGKVSSLISVTVRPEASWSVKVSGGGDGGEGPPPPPQPKGTAMAKANNMTPINNHRLRLTDIIKSHPREEKPGEKTPLSRPSPLQGETHSQRLLKT